MRLPIHGKTVTTRFTVVLKTENVTARDNHDNRFCNLGGLVVVVAVASATTMIISGWSNEPDQSKP